MRGKVFESYWEAKVPILKPPLLRVNGFSFLGRMTMYRYLIHQYDAPEFDGLWGTPAARERHWLWAYVAQLDWQQYPGRLAAHPSFSLPDTFLEWDNAITPLSWWGTMNFMFSVALLVGGIRAHNTGQSSTNIIHLQLDRRSQSLLEHDAATRECVALW